MSLIPWRTKRVDTENRDPAAQSAIERFRHELDRLFDNFLQEGKSGFDRLLSPITGWGPAVDVSETEQDITVRAELPGIDPKDLEIQVTADSLRISGEKKDEFEEKRKGYYQVERKFGSFHRIVKLPTEIDPDKVDAEHRNGILTIRLCKTAGASARRISIKHTEGQT
ncbi:MAG: Hsp20/alpha crystallin family protein [Phycisphaerae bacterium]|nr:Hsp20/alpha crystallin family protein [Phycisphaerae bacterium]